MLTEKTPHQFTTIIETEPVHEPVTVAEAKNYLRVDTTEDDTLILTLIKTARSICENLSNRYFHQRAITQKQTGGVEVIDFMRSPAQTVTSITYTPSADGTPESFTDYYYTSERLFTADRFRVGRQGDGYIIQYTAGMVADATPSTVSDSIKTAILRTVGYLYENRQEGASGMSEQGFSISYTQSQDIQKILNPISSARSFL